jgi:hypothetical protein
MAKFFLTNKAGEDLSKICNSTCEVWSENQADKSIDSTKHFISSFIELRGLQNKKRAEPTLQPFSKV